MEKIARFPGEVENLESCHISDCHGFFGPETSQKCENCRKSRTAKQGGFKLGGLPDLGSSIPNGLFRPCNNVATFPLFRRISRLVWESLNAGLAKGGLGTCPQLSTIAYDCRHFETKVPLRKGPKRSQMCTIVDDCAHIPESGLKPPFESPRLDFPDESFSSFPFFLSIESTYKEHWRRGSATQSAPFPTKVKVPLVWEPPCLASLKQNVPEKVYALISCLNISYRHFLKSSSVLNLMFDFIFEGGCTREEQIALSLKRHLFPHAGRKPKAFWIYFSTLPPILNIFSNA